MERFCGAAGTANPAPAQEGRGILPKPPEAHHQNSTSFPRTWNLLNNFYHPLQNPIFLLGTVGFTIPKKTVRIREKHLKAASRKSKWNR
ncbi:hypothetical protein LEP1GSC047_2747 [Leptospira inadai serovar Lyme str. 10]|uniref:Uncharacterized protein n=2 Tax=Leptospira inadai serovar Lyme TaxID=293084 RepID=V6HAS1_9LEPT|nr:hypothetical protein LEP1GSC047_2747 [Leptospira inadai serovar Lyme str. 10]PNV76463.1 hypothetical protein BES34_002390 [Leptospira inadai serovar Lyme]